MFLSVKWRSLESQKKPGGSGLLLTVGRRWRVHRQKTTDVEEAGLGCSGFTLTSGAESSFSESLNLYGFIEPFHGNDFVGCVARKAIGQQSTWITSSRGISADSIVQEDVGNGNLSGQSGTSRATVKSYWRVKSRRRKYKDSQALGILIITLPSSG